MKHKFIGWVMGAERRKRSARETGQVLVIIAVAAIGLIAIMGLAIDGGRLLLLKRQTQNAANASTMAATFALCTGGTEDQVIKAGEDAARQHGYVNGVKNTYVYVQTPVDSGVNDCEECSVQVDIRRSIPSYFIAVVFSGDLVTTSHTVGTCNPNGAPTTLPDPADPASVPLIQALYAGRDCGNSLTFSGSFSEVVGGFYSCGDVQSTGSDHPVYGQGYYVGDGGPFSPGTTWHDYSEYDGYEGPPPVCGAGCDPDDPATGSGDPPMELAQCYMDNTVTPPQPKWPAEVSILDIADYEPIPADELPGGIPWRADMATRLEAGDVYAAYDDAVGSGCPNASPGWISRFQDDGFLTTDGAGNQWLKDGIYFFDCPTVNLNDLTANNITVVSTGDVHWNGNITAGPYEDGILLYTTIDESNVCTESSGIHISTSSNQLSGIIFAPNGNIQFSSSDTNPDGARLCLIGATIGLSGSQTRIVCDPAIVPDQNGLFNEESG